MESLLKKLIKTEDVTPSFQYQRRSKRAWMFEGVKMPNRVWRHKWRKYDD